MSFSKLMLMAGLSTSASALQPGGTHPSFFRVSPSGPSAPVFSLEPGIAGRFGRQLAAHGFPLKGEWPVLPSRLEYQQIKVARRHIPGIDELGCDMGFGS